MSDHSAVTAQKIAVEIDKIIKIAKAAQMDVVVYVLETAKSEAVQAGDNAKPTLGAVR
jgi:hypothetical protein